MTPPKPPLTFPDFELAAAAALAWTFVGLYGLRSRWRINRVGRSLMYLIVSLAGVLTTVSASVFLGRDYPYRTTVRTVVYGLLVLNLIGMLRVLVTQQRKPRDDPDRDLGRPMQRAEPPD